MFLRKALFSLLAFGLFTQTGYAAGGKTKPAKPNAPATRGVKFKNNPTALSAEAGKSVTIPLRSLLSDIGTGNLSWSSLDALPGWLVLNNAAETLTANPQVADAGTKSFRLTVQDAGTGQGDDSGALTQVNFTVMVVPVWPDELDLGNIPERQPYSLDLRTKVQFAGTGALVFSVEGTLPPWLTLTPAGILSGTPERKDVGPFAAIKFVATATVGGGSSKVPSKGVVVKVNQAPRWLANPTVLANGKEDSGYSQSLTPFATDPDGDTLNFTKLSGPAWANFAADGAVTGTPRGPDRGLNTFSVRVSDGNGGTAVADVTIFVNSTNHPPQWTENPVRFSVAEKTAFTKSIADKATDQDLGDTVKFFKLSGPAWATLSATGVFTGTPPTDALGDNKVVVRADDGNGGTADVDVIITVTNLNDPPFWTANPIVLPNGPEKSPYTADLAPFAKDPDPGDTLTFSKISGPAWVTISSLGAVTGTPQRPDVGINTIRVRIRDAGGLIADVDVKVTIDKVNTPPRWVQNPIALPQGTEDSPYAYNLFQHATDDDNDVLTYSLVSGPTWLKVTSDGKLAGTPGAGDIGNFTAVFEVSDGKATARATGNGAVAMKNHAPELNLAALNFTIKERQNFTEKLNDPKYVTDKNGDRLIFTFLDTSDWVQISSNGDLFANPLHKHLGDHTFRFSVSDGTLVSQGTLKIKVVRDALPPVWSQNPIRFTTPARTPFANTVADKVKDPDNVPLTITKKSGPAWLTVSASGTLSGTPGDTEVGDNTFVLTAKNDVVSADVTVIVTVTAKNHPPTPNQANLSFTVKERTQLNVKLNDPKYVTDLDGDGLVFTLLDNKSFVTLSSNGDLFLNPAHKDIGVYALKFRISDGKEPVEAMLNITVVADPKPPTWTQNPINYTTVARVPFSKNLADKVTDVDGDPITFTKKSGPAWLSVSPSGIINGTPKDADIGTNNFVITAKNLSTGADADVIITVIQGNKDPYWTQNPLILPNATSGKAYSQNVSSFAGDPDNQPLTFSKISGSDWLNVSTSGQLIGTPDNSHIGLNKFTVRVTDPDGAFADTEVQIRVEKPNRPPRWTQDPVQLGDTSSEKPFTFSLVGKAVDDDGDILTFKLINGPAWMNVAVDGTITGTPAATDLGDYTAVFEVSDGKVAVQAGGVGRVLKKNDPPTINQANLAFTVREREVRSLSINDPSMVFDPDGDTLTFTLIDTSNWVTLSSSGDLVMKPLHQHIGDHTFKFKVFDGKLTSNGTINIKVIADPQAPQWLQNPVRLQATVRQPFSETLADKVKDPDGLPVTFTKRSGPSWLNVSPSGALSGTPQDVDLGDNNFVVTVANSFAGADAQVIVTVVSDNKPPFWTQDPIALPDAKSGVTYSQSVAPYAKDPENERLTFEKISGPSWAFLTTAGMVIGTPAATDGGVNTLTVRVKDPHNAFADATVQIVIDSGTGNHAPEWTQKPLNLGSARVNVPFTFDLSKYAKDQDGDALTFKMVNGPTWMFVSPAGQITGTPQMKDLGQFTAIFEVSDGKASDRVDAFGKVIDGANKPPEIMPEALSFIMKERQVLTVDINKPKYVVDPEGDPITFELLDTVDWVTLTSTGTLTMAPLHKDLGDHSYNVRVSDDKGASSDGTLFIRVLPDGEPIIWLQDPIVFETNVNELFAQDLKPFVQDPANLPLTFTKKSGPAWLTIAGDGKISGTPLTANLGDNNFVVSVTNGSVSADGRLLVRVKPASPIEDKVVVDSAVPGAPAENVWVIDNSWPWLGQNWLINELKAKINVFFDALDAAQIHYSDVYLSSDAKKWKGEPIPDSSGDVILTWQDNDKIRSFRDRLDSTKTTKCYNSPIWSMNLFYKMAPQLPLYHNGFFTEAVPNDVFILTKHTDYYRNFSKGTAQASWNAPEFADSFIDFHKKEKQPYRISALAPECPKLLDPYPEDPDSQPVLNGRDNPYMTLVKKTNGSYYALDCNIKIEKILADYAQKVIFRAYVHAKNRIPLSKKPSDPSQIKVSIGNVVIPGNTGSAQDKWFYDPAKNEVIIRWHLIDMTTVKPGDVIKIEYKA